MKTFFHLRLRCFKSEYNSHKIPKGSENDGTIWNEFILASQCAPQTISEEKLINQQARKEGKMLFFKRIAQHSKENEGRTENKRHSKYTFKWTQFRISPAAFSKKT